MKYLKRILFFFLVLFTFAFSLENGEESKVVLQKRRETTQMKIGVIKLISKELPLEFHVDSKKIYGEIDIEDNDLVFVSETLDEIPSVSTTNGRKSINNIKRYLTKDIKKAPKFEYQIVNVKDEGEEENGKKYLLVNCKEQLSGIYVYVLERGSYKIKSVYKGVFKQLYSIDASEIYGDLTIGADILDRSLYRRVTIQGGNLFVSNIGDYNSNDISIKDDVKFTGKFPEKVLFDVIKKESGRKDPYVKVHITSKYNSNSSEVRAEKGKDGYCDYETAVTLKDSTGQDSTQIGVVSSENYNDGNLSIFIKRPRPFEDDEYKVELQYGYYWVGKFYEVIKHTFTIKVIGDGEQLLPESTNGKILFDRTESFMINVSTIIGGNVDGETPNVISIPNKEYRSVGKFLKKPLRESLNVNAIQDGVDLKVSLKTSTIAGLDKNQSPQTVILKKNAENNWDGKIAENDISFILYDKIGRQIGDSITLFSDSENDDYYKIKINGWDSEYIHQVIEAEFTLTYEKVINRGKKEQRKVLKKDIYTIIVTPKEEKIPPNTRGTLIITNPTQLAGHDIFIDRSGQVGIRTNIKHSSDGKGPATFKKEQLIWSGELPKKFITAGDNNTDNNWVNWGNNARLIVRGDNGFGEVSTTPSEYDYKTGIFWLSEGSGGWNKIKTTKGNRAGWIYFSSTAEDKNSDTLVIGFSGGSALTPMSNWQMTLNGGIVNYRFEFVYQTKIGNEWIDKKVDVLDLIIQPGFEAKNPTIELRNPLVYYDYDASSAISNVVHNRRVHLAQNEATTLNNTGSKFTKNTDLTGKNWIDPSDQILDYPWEALGKHKVSINRGTNEVIKVTKENGGTNSSTYLKSNGNEVMFSYDGGNKYLNFGLSKYNFDGGEINDIVITHYSDKALESRTTYSVRIPEFEGIHYMGNYDIKPKQDYTKNYQYDPSIAYDKGVIIDYGTVGFRDLDTRITEQSGGEGIDFRATRKVKLVSEDGTYVIRDVKLYFEKDKEEESDDGGKTSRFKGENERATSAMLKLEIPRQETLIPQGRFTILTDDENNTDKNPLRIGVTVNSDKEKYYTYIDGTKENQSNIKNLYLNLTINRFIETNIIFENPALANVGGEKWIKLNKTDYPNGELTGNIDGSLLWGRVRGEVIDIPVDKYSNLKMTLFDEKGGILVHDLGSEKEKRKEFMLTTKTVNNKDRHFILNYENKNDNFISFTLDNGYDPDKENPIKFYIRYFDCSKEKEDFLFDQRFTVKFEKKKNYKGDIYVRFKNPSMTKNYNNGIIDLFSKDKYVGNNNNFYTKDGINWVDIRIDKNVIEEIKKDFFSGGYELKDIDNPNKFIDESNLIIQLNENNFQIALPENFNEFNNVFENYTGQEIDKTFELKFNNDDSKAYRLNIIIDKFDPKYYGKVFEGDVDKDIDGTTGKYLYKEVNSVGHGKINLRDNNNLQGEYVYVDLNTSYRDYLRYNSLPTSVLTEELYVWIKGKVEAIPKGSSSKVLQGDIVFFDRDNNKYIEIGESNKKKIITTGIAPLKSYSLKLRLNLEEYRKLKPYEEYEIFYNGNPNVLTISTDKNNLKDNILFNKPLNFDTEGPGLTIETTVLDFGLIELEKETAPLIIKDGKTKEPIKVVLNGELDSNLGIQNSILEVNTDNIWIKQKNINNEFMKNGGKLKVRDLKLEKITLIPNKPQENLNTEKIEYYDLHGTLEVPKNTPEENYGTYSGTVTVTYTFY